MLRYLYESWFTLLPSPWPSIVLPPIAALAGALVGFEREHRDKPAGLRTMSLVSLAACVFTVIGFVFTSNTGDSGRVAAQIVAGIGFLGGGMIFRASEGVQGATTAVTIWVMASIGMVIGAGYPVGGLMLTLFVLSVLGAVGDWESGHFGGRTDDRFAIVFANAGGKTRVRLEHLFERYPIRHSVASEEGLADGLTRWTLEVSMSKKSHRELLLALADMPEVVAIERD